jgi:dTDP-4-amino-4,6-dideoxygalactose transaminase
MFIPKRSIDELALLSGVPVFADPLVVGRPNHGDRSRLLARINQSLDSHRLTNDGPLVRELEQRLGDLLNVRHCVAMCNGTVALEILLRALDLTGEIIVPAMTFVATAHAVRWLGLTPVFAEIDPASHCLDPRDVERRITSRTSAILGVHVWGQPCDVAGLTAVAERHGLALLFDAAHALGCSLDGRLIGNFGAAEVFSLHATKFLHTFEGGAVTTNDSALAGRLRLMRNFGFAGYDQVVELGTNGKLNEVSAAMGLTLLDDWEELLAANARTTARYHAGLAGLPGLAWPQRVPAGQHNHQYVVVEVDPGLAGLNRDDLLAVLWAENVHARRYFFPGVHRMEPYLSCAPWAGARLPHTEAVVDRVLVLPAGAGITEDEVDQVCALLRLALAHPAEVKAALNQPAAAASAA